MSTASNIVNEVHVLFEGFFKQDTHNERYQRANCTCTLIKSVNDYNVIVDTMTAWDGERIVEALQKHNLTQKDIKAVVSTHGHSDHIGNNNLFLNAEWHIVGQCVSHKDKYLNFNFQTDYFPLTDSIQVMATPGHTLSCVSVIVNNSNLGKKVGICGDLFEKMEDIMQPEIWISAGSEDPTAQRKNRIKMAELCTYIIPGHGGGFLVNDNMRIKLKDECFSLK